MCNEKRTPDPQPWTVERAVAYIHAARDHRGKDGLTNMVRLCALLGNPERALCAVHVAGTNGKGSTCACLDAMLRAAGYRVGLYTSPFLQRYAERIRIDGVPIADEAFLTAFAPVYTAVEALHAESVFPTPFEIGTALAFTAFAQANVDLCVIEVGLGGRLDPTNVLLPKVCAITAIGLDHQHLLGDTPAAIAGEKAGIIKPNTPVVTAVQSSPEVDAVFAARSAERSAPWYPLTGQELIAQPTDPAVTHATDPAADAAAASLPARTWCCAATQSATFSYRGWTLPCVQLALLGAHQLQNAATALAVIACLRDLGWRIPDHAALNGLANVRWPGRLEWFQGASDANGLATSPDVLLDGAHNAHGARALADYVATLPREIPRVLLCGTLAEKISPDMADALAKLAPTAIVVAPPDHRALPPEQLAALLSDRGIHATACHDLLIALAHARQRVPPDGLVIVAGSLYLIGALRTLLEEERFSGGDASIPPL